MAAPGHPRADERGCTGNLAKNSRNPAMGLQLPAPHGTGATAQQGTVGSWVTASVGVGAAWESGQTHERRHAKLTVRSPDKN